MRAGIVFISESATVLLPSIAGRLSILAVSTLELSPCVFFLPLPTRVSRFNAFRARGNRRLFFVLVPVSGGAAVHMLELAVISDSFFILNRGPAYAKYLQAVFFQPTPPNPFLYYDINL